MRMINTRWRVLLAISAGLVCGVPTVRAQELAPPVELSQPLESAPLPIAAAAAISDDEEPVANDVSLLPSKAEAEEEFTLPESRQKPELIQERYPNGLIKIEREMLQDAEGNFVYHGLFRSYDGAGQLALEGRFERNMKQGVWHKRHPGNDSALFGTAPYKDFQAPFSSQANFRDGYMHGKWLIVDAQRRKVSEIEFANGQRHGKAAWYYTNGAPMKELRFENGLIQGDALQWGPDGKITAREVYQDGRKLATKVDSYPDGRKRQEVTYLYAPVEMATPDNWESATLAVFENRGQDERHGSFRSWHPNGQLARQAEFRNNLPVKTGTWWFANGQKQMEGMYIDGRAHDIWTWWHANGQKSVAGYYNDGNPTGVWSWWSESGKLAQKVDLTEDDSDVRTSRRSAQPLPGGMPNMVDPNQILR